MHAACHRAGRWTALLAHPPIWHVSYGAWREGTHDDLVLATALACWAGERLPSGGLYASDGMGGSVRRIW